MESDFCTGKGVEFTILVTSYQKNSSRGVLGEEMWIMNDVSYQTVNKDVFDISARNSVWLTKGKQRVSYLGHAGQKRKGKP